MKKNNGFTLIEVMVTILILGILAAFTIPGFQNIIDKSRIRSTDTDLIQLLRVARLTAVEERTTVMVCGSTNGTSCGSNINDWGTSILAVEVDPNNGNAVVKTLGVVNVDERAVVKKNNTNNLSVDFQPSGWSPGDQASIFVCSTGGGNKNSYRIYVSMSGKIRNETFENSPNQASWGC